MEQEAMLIHVYNIVVGGSPGIQIFVRETCLLDAHRRAERWVENNLIDPDSVPRCARFSHIAANGEHFPGDEPTTFVQVQRYEKAD